MSEAIPADTPVVFEELLIGRPPGLVSRLFTTWRHFTGLAFWL